MKILGVCTDNNYHILGLFTDKNFQILGVCRYYNFQILGFCDSKKFQDLKKLKIAPIRKRFRFSETALLSDQ